MLFYLELKTPAEYESQYAIQVKLLNTQWYDTVGQHSYDMAYTK